MNNLPELTQNDILTHRIFTQRIESIDNIKDLKEVVVQLHQQMLMQRRMFIKIAHQDSMFDFDDLEK